MSDKSSQLPLFAANDQGAGFIADRYSPDSNVTLFPGDRLGLLEQIKQAGSQAELIITSPPYNVGKEYETICNCSGW